MSSRWCRRAQRLGVLRKLRAKGGAFVEGHVAPDAKLVGAGGTACVRVAAKGDLVRGKKDGHVGGGSTAEVGDVGGRETITPSCLQADEPHNELDFALCEVGAGLPIRPEHAKTMRRTMFEISAAEI